MPILKNQPKVDEVIEDEALKAKEASENLVEARRIEIEILKTIQKPLGFDHVEVKHLGNHRHRVSVITKIFQNDCLFPTISRPLSWYVVVAGSDLTFSPTLGKN